MAQTPSESPARHAPLNRPAEGPDVRRNDHAGSQAGSRAVAPRKINQRDRMLCAWGTPARHGGNGRTDEEAAQAAGLLGSCYWKRAGELRRLGLIRDTGELRHGSANVRRMVSEITEAGWMRIAQLAREHSLL